MFCPECGNRNPDAAKFCMKCGSNFNQLASSIKSTQYLPPRQSVVTKDSKKLPSSIVTLLSLGFGGIVILMLFVPALLKNSNVSYNQPGFQNSSNTSSQPNYSSQLDSPPQMSKPQAQKHSIVSEAFTVGAGEMRYFGFTIPEDVSTGNVLGNFIASGGYNDIRVLITNETGLTNIKSRNNFKAFYDSGKVTTDDIDTRLAPGHYYVVFSNAEAMITPKAVNADISVEY